jgi:hypothetical protein
MLNVFVLAGVSIPGTAFFALWHTGTPAHWREASDLFFAYAHRKWQDAQGAGQQGESGRA